MSQITVTFADGSTAVLPVHPSSTLKFSWLTSRGPGLTPAFNEESYAVDGLASVTVDDDPQPAAAAVVEPDATPVLADTQLADADPPQAA